MRKKWVCGKLKKLFDLEIQKKFTTFHYYLTIKELSSMKKYQMVAHMLNYIIQCLVELEADQKK
jgi:hypothetical protein